VNEGEVLVPDAAAMQAFAADFAAELRAGDLVILSGPLGAGKTTFVQGLAQGLQVRGAVTSPTFVIARVHRSRVGGPDLVHVDAYRLGSLAEVDDLDLDASMDVAVTVVEWGEGKVEGLTDGHITVRIARDAAEGEVRRVTVQRVSSSGGGSR
jgi:tRNA threonylcarbamoyladenosine biosynthesis protein TsaE